jgi:hypothetical protein
MRRREFTTLNAGSRVQIIAQLGALQRDIRESGARLMRAREGRSLGGRMPTAALRASMARSAAGSLRDQRNAGRWPLSRLAGNRARTLGALIYAASNPSPPRPRAELGFTTSGTAKSFASKTRSVRCDSAVFSVREYYSCTTCRHPEATERSSSSTCNAVSTIRNLGEGTTLRLRETSQSC